jgi:hypothetical protein
MHWRCDADKNVMHTVDGAMRMMHTVMVQCRWCTQRWCNADDIYSDGAMVMMHTVMVQCG